MAFKLNSRIIKFGLVGVSSVIIQTALFNILILFTKLSPSIATLVADQFAIVTSFIINNKFTFSDTELKDIALIIKAFFKFYWIVIFSTILQTIIVFFGTNIFGTSFFVSNFFFVLGLAVTLLWNYNMQKKHVWKNKN
ncbi:MAG TPA: GtrA family protein [Candidatus Saccharimonadales bacterium]|nr:GtrA family protein [Candidatus Saccharimonadales bacterium]